jgi:hypothetical protein
MFPIYFLYMIQGTLPYLHVHGDPALRKRWKWKAGCILSVDSTIPHGHGTAPVRAHPPGISIMVPSGSFRIATSCEIQCRATFI